MDLPDLPELQAPAGWRTIDIVSDLHLQAGEPATHQAWQACLNRADRADALFILGDFFEVWVGDDLLDPPEPVEAIAELPDGAPARFTWRRLSRRVTRADGPERLSPEWWRPRPDDRQVRTRDYYRVEDSAGRRFWLFRLGLWERAASAPRWFLHGVFA